VKLITRRKSSQRAAAPITVTFYPNFAGQNGLPVLILESEEMYYTLEPESLDEVKQVMSQAHILHHNFPDTRKVEGEKE
jgi:hypothetical protein